MQTRRDELKKRIDEQAGNKALAEQMPLIVSLLNNEFSENSEFKTDNESEFSEISINLAKAETAKNDANEAYEKCNEKFAKTNYEQLLADNNNHVLERDRQKDRREKYRRVGQILDDYLHKKQNFDNEKDELSKLKENLKICEDILQTAKTEFEAMDSEFEIQKGMVNEHIKLLRSKLVDGQPCPLCGSTTHQYHDERIVSTLFASVEKNWKAKKDAYEMTKDEKNKKETNVNLLEKNIKNWEKQLEDTENNLKKECGGKLILDKDVYQKGFADSESKIKAENDIIAEINEKITAAKAIQDELKQLQKRKTDADEAYKSILRKLAYKWKHLNDELLKVDAEIVKNTEKANGIKHLESIVQTNLKTKNEEKQLVETALKDADKAKVQETLEMLGKAVAEMRARISLNDQNAKQSQAAKDDLQAKTSQLTLWTQLADAIGTTATNNFRDVAQAYTMRILLDQANYYLHKLSQRYELTCYSNSLAIMVMDKEMGGELRTASSLSGGETFLVSLALALGLASLNDENLNIDMLFIDEGFGTLDGESLEMAVTALGNMQKFGKKVGIISHVDSLKERIPAQIRVTKRGKAASTVIVV